MRNKLSILALCLMSASLWFVISPHKTLAAIPYSSANLISDAEFTDHTTMSAADIQNFLNSKNSGIKSYSDVENCSPPTPTAPYSYTYYPHCGTTQSAATIIYDAAQAYRINPRAILATLQKEQGLITDPTAPANNMPAINCAMGYNSCGGYSGFFNQVDNGAWQLREYIESMNGRTWWGTSYYPCNDTKGGTPSHSNGGNVGNGAIYYSTGLYPGRTVTFYDYNGDPYTTITLANSATAGLYCYTPHAYPGSSANYFSGSYWFVYYYETWWPSFVAQPVWQSVYTDNTKATSLGWGANLVPAQSAWVVLQFRNTGSATWTTGGGGTDVRVITAGAFGRQSGFCTSAWIQTDPNGPNCNRPVALSGTVAPGDVATFEFPVTAPGSPGTFNEGFGLIIDGQTILGGGTIVVPFKVSPLSYNARPIWQKVYSDSTKSNTPSWNATLLPGQTAWAVVTMENTGNFTWTKNGSYNVRMITSGPFGRVSSICYGPWIPTNPGCTRPTGLGENNIAPGQAGTFEFPFAAPTIPGVYNETFGLIVDGQSVFSSGFINLQVTVQTPQYSAQPVWQGVYTNNTKSTLIGWNASINRSPGPGNTEWVVLVMKNTGNITWTKNGGGNDVRLITYGGWGHQSIFCNQSSGWITTSPICTRPATFTEANVPPGSTGTFEFQVNAPSYAGTFNEAFGLVIDGRTVFPNSAANVQFTVN